MSQICWTYFYKSFRFTALKMFVFTVFLIRIFPCSVRMRENTDQKNSEYGQFSGSDLVQDFQNVSYHFGTLCIKVLAYKILRNDSHKIVD